MSLEGLKDLSALADPEVGGAVSGLTRPDVALTRRGLSGPSVNLRRSSVPAFPRGTPPSGQLESITAGELVYRISGLEQSTITQHGMHDDSEAAGERDPGLSEAAPLRDLERPALQREALPGARQDRVGRFVQQLANGAVPLLGDPARPVELARLVPPGNQPKVGTSRP